MKKNTKQYTIRNIPLRVDRMLRERVRESGKSFNQVAIDALVSGISVTGNIHRDLSDIVDSMSALEGENMEEAIRSQRQVDLKAWK